MSAKKTSKSKKVSKEKLSPPIKKQSKPLEKLANKEVSTIKELPQRACMKCHFLAEEQNDTEEAGLEPYEIEPKICHYQIVADIRNLMRKNDFSGTQFPLTCFRECWRAIYNKNEQYRAVVEEDRSSCHLFYPYKQGMSFDAAKEMQEKKQSNKAESIAKSVAETEESKKHQAKRVSHKKGKLKRGERQPNIPDKELFPFVKKDLKFLTSSKGGGLGGGALAKRIKNDIENKFDDKYGDKAKYKLGTVKNLISKINTGRK